MTSRDSLDHTGILSTATLRARGMKPHEIRGAVASGKLVKVCHGWYARPGAPLKVMRAVQAGGRAGCITGAEAHGLWTLPNQPLHVLTGEGCDRRRRSDVVYHATQLPQYPHALFPLEDCLRHILHRHTVEDVLIAVESAVNLGKISAARARTILESGPLHNAAAASHFRPGAMSGTETRVRLFLQRLRHPVRPQANISTLGFVDLLVGRSLIIECDSFTHHSGEQVPIDHGRSLAAHKLGYKEIRLSFEQVWTSWDQTRTFLRTYLMTGSHLAPPRPLAA